MAPYQQSGLGHEEDYVAAEFIVTLNRMSFPCTSFVLFDRRCSLRRIRQEVDSKEPAILILSNPSLSIFLALSFNPSSCELCHVTQPVLLFPNYVREKFFSAAQESFLKESICSTKYIKMLLRTRKNLFNPLTYDLLQFLLRVQRVYLRFDLGYIRVSIYMLINSFQRASYVQLS